MEHKKITLAVLIIGLLGFAGIAFGAPTTTYQRNLYPEQDNTYDLGTTTLKWRNLNVGLINGLVPGSGGSSTSSPFNPCAYWATSTPAFQWGSICLQPGTVIPATSTVQNGHFTTFVDAHTPSEWTTSTIIIPTGDPIVGGGGVFTQNTTDCLDGSSCLEEDLTSLTSGGFQTGIISQGTGYDPTLLYTASTTYKRNHQSNGMGDDPGNISCQVFSTLPINELFGGTPGKIWDYHSGSWVDFSFDSFGNAINCSGNNTTDWQTLNWSGSKPSGNNGSSNIFYNLLFLMNDPPDTSDTIIVNQVEWGTAQTTLNAGFTFTSPDTSFPLIFTGAPVLIGDPSDTTGALNVGGTTTVNNISIEGAFSCTDPSCPGSSGNPFGYIEVNGSDVPFDPDTATPTTSFFTIQQADDMNPYENKALLYGVDGIDFRQNMGGTNGLIATLFTGHDSFRDVTNTQLIVGPSSTELDIDLSQDMSIQPFFGFSKNTDNNDSLLLVNNNFEVRGFGSTSTMLTVEQNGSEESTLLQSYGKGGFEFDTPSNTIESLLYNADLNSTQIKDSNQLYITDNGDTPQLLIGSGESNYNSVTSTQLRVQEGGIDFEAGSNFNSTGYLLGIAPVDFGGSEGGTLFHNLAHCYFFQDQGGPVFSKFCDYGADIAGPAIIHGMTVQGDTTFSLDVTQDNGTAQFNTTTIEGDGTITGNLAVGPGMGFIGSSENDLGVGQSNSFISSSNSGIFGANSEAHANFTFAAGNENYTRSEGAIALGSDNDVSGFSSVGFGYDNTVTGQTALAMGDTNQANATTSIALGKGMIVNGQYSMGINLFNANSAETLNQSHTLSIMDGTVGIGTTTPDAPLTVFNTSMLSQIHILSASSTTSTGGGYLISANSNNLEQSAGSRYSGSGGQWIASVANPTEWGMNNGTIDFFTDSGLTPGTMFGPTSRLHISNNGNIGIATTTPGAALTVSNGDVYITSSTRGFILTSPNGTCYRFTVANGGALNAGSAVTCP